MSVSRQVPVINWVNGVRRNCDDEVAAEVPVALSYNKQSHVVMMVTPTALDDFGVGFSLTEGIIDQVADILDVSVIERENGLEVAMKVNEDIFARLAGQRRNLTGRTGCGLCGAESLDQAMRKPAVVNTSVSVSAAALQAAILSLNAHQPLQVVTGAVHGAAWCSNSGEILTLREDVGRHNALDKLIGFLSRKCFDPSTGFVLVSSRASYEMVYKAAAVGMEVLVSVSAPTALAIDFAHRSGVTLVGFARPGRHNVYTFDSRVT
ncbi:MAG: formate dehydrogenase accessory sulfurtransferase FdhD [Xanthomonadales bacterium]|nr:formate dehydrogenase accessory sulfurtransferase FdhD [Xanthomonadales bacterium]